MNKLTNIAAVATIVGAIYTVVPFYLADDPLISSPEEFSEIINVKQNVGLISVPVKNEAVALVENKNVSENIRENIMTRYSAASQIPYTSDKSEALAGLVKLAADNKLYDEAIKMADDIPYTSDKSKAFSYIAKRATRTHPNIALKAANLIPYTSTRSETLKLISMGK